MAEPIRHLRRHVALLSFFSFLGPFGGNMVLSMLHRLTQEFGTGLAVISLSVSLYMIPFAVLQLVAGPLSDLWDRRKTLMLGIVVFIAGVLVCALAPSVHIFLVGRIISGLGYAFVTPAVFAMTGDIVPIPRRGKAMGWMGSMNMLGVALGPLMGGLFAEIDWRLAFYALALIAAVGLTIFHFSDIAEAVEKAAAPPLRGMLRKAAGNWGLMVASATGFLAMFAYVSVLTSLSPYLARAPFEFSDSWVGGVIACAGIGGILVSPVGGWIADRAGRAATAALGLACVAAAYGALTMAHSWTVMACLFFIIGAAISFCWAGLITLSVELLPAERGTSTAIFNSVRFFGYALAPQFSSFLFVRAGMKPLFLTAAVCSVVGVLLALALTKAERGGTKV